MSTEKKNIEQVPVVQDLQSSPPSSLDVLVAYQALFSQVLALTTEQNLFLSRNLERLKGIFHDAMGKFNNDFLLLHQLLSKEKNAIQDSIGVGDDAEKESLLTLFSHIEKQLYTLLNSLQFEDMIAQILESLNHDLGLMRELMRDLCEDRDIANADETVLKQFLNQLHEKIFVLKNVSLYTRKESVQQENMDDGDVDLF